MRAKFRHPGITLMEMTVTIAVAALLVGLGLPAAKTLYRSFESEGGALTVISSALASARAIAAKEQRYAGIRFQMRYDPNNPLTASQYIIFIIHDYEATGLEPGFRAVKDIEPIKLPGAIAVMDMTTVARVAVGYSVQFVETPVTAGNDIDSVRDFLDTTCFSVVFSPSGKLVRHEVRVRNRHGIPDTSTNNEWSGDDVFNKKNRVDAGLAMFYQDDYCGLWWSPYATDLGIGPEFSRDRFVIADREKFIAAYNHGYHAWSEYLNQVLGNVKATYISPYTGTIIKE